LIQKSALGLTVSYVDVVQSAMWYAIWAERSLHRWVRAALFSMQGKPIQAAHYIRRIWVRYPGKLAHFARRGLKMAEYRFSWLSLCS
jgi:hypothetical protein